jgi:hypothetical protein
MKIQRCQDVVHTTAKLFQIDRAGVVRRRHEHWDARLAQNALGGGAEEELPNARISSAAHHDQIHFVLCGTPQDLGGRFPGRDDFRELDGNLASRGDLLDQAIEIAFRLRREPRGTDVNLRGLVKQRIADREHD